MKLLMKRLQLCAAVFLLSSSSSYAIETVKISGLVELTGNMRFAGMHFNNGVRLAIKEINESGGILGRQIEYQYYDTQSNSGVARGLAEKVVSEDVYVVMGPVFSGSAMVSMNIMQEAEVPQFIGGEAAAITRQGNPYVFRTSVDQTGVFPRMVRFLKESVDAQTVDIIHVNNDFGVNGKNVLVNELLKQNIAIGDVLESGSGQLHFSRLVRKAMGASGDVLFLYLNEEGSVRLLKELKNKGYSKPIMGETVLTSQAVIERVGSAAEGIIAHVGTTIKAPNPLVENFSKRYQKEYGVLSDHNGIKGYIGMYTVKAVTEKVGKFDSKLFALTMKNLSLSAKENPGLLMDLRYDHKGDLNRETYMTRIVNGKQEVFEVLRD